LGGARLTEAGEVLFELLLPVPAIFVIFAVELGNLLVAPPAVIFVMGRASAAAFSEAAVARAEHLA
jgi:hypothetical protein